jgi:tRNA threonylcarbamoyladenosine biosynthesis protein TsaE
MNEFSFERQVDSPEAMVALGAEIASDLSDGSVLALCGGLGAGKTHFTKGLASGLGCTGEVTSPTFSLAHEYTGGRIPLFHFDFYRMENQSEVLRIGWDEYLDAEGVVVVEWADKFSELFPANTLWFKFALGDEGVRLVSVSKTNG